MLLDHETRRGLRIQVDSVVRRNLGLPSRVSTRSMRPGSRQVRWTDDQIREKIRAVANALGKSKITKAEYVRFINDCDGALFPSHVTVSRCRDEFVQS